MNWIPPKTDWVPTDWINAVDYNRVTNNLNYLSKKFSITIEDMEINKQYHDLPFYELYNVIEDNLDTINLNTYNFDIGDKKVFAVNTPYIDYAEYNRIETWTDKIYKQMIIQRDTGQHYDYTFNGPSIYRVPRVAFTDHEPVGYRLEFRLGSRKGDIK